MAVPARIDEAGRRVDEESQPPERALAFETGHEVVRQRDALQRRAEHELARVEDESFLGIHLDELRQLLHLLLHVDERVARVAKNPEEAVDPDVDARGLQELLGVRVDADPAFLEQPADRAVGEDHGRTANL